MIKIKINAVISNIRSFFPLPKETLSIEKKNSFKNELVEEFNSLTQAFFTEIDSLKSDALTTDAPTEEHFSYISSLREEIE